MDSSSIIETVTDSGRGPGGASYPLPVQSLVGATVMIDSACIGARCVVM